MIKVYKIIYIFILIILAPLVMINIFPVKLAITESGLKDKEYMICEVIKTTGFDWRVEKSSYGYKGLVILEGNIPIEGYEFGITYGENKFVVYGEFVSDIMLYGDDKYRIFNVEKWDILYPVHRNSLREFIGPKYGINLLDIYYD